jgi:hypothetical protein
MIRHYCTHFDQRYMARGLAMVRSLRRVAPNAVVWVLGLDEATQRILERINEPNVRLISLPDFAEGDPELVTAKTDGRSLVEYYFSVKPALITHVLRAAPETQMVTYVDADLWFFADPEPVFTQAGMASIILTPHRFPPGQEAMEATGKFNAGWISLRRTADGFAALGWWRARCLEWCFDHVDEANGRYADQRYLDRLAAEFPGIHISRHPGANLAPWNVGSHILGLSRGNVLVDGCEPLIFFHVHGMRRVGHNLYITPQDLYRSDASPLTRDIVYKPYLTALCAIGREIAPLMPATAGPQLSRTGTSRLGARLKWPLQIVRAAARGTLIRAAE